MQTTQKQLSRPLISEISFTVFRQLDNISDWMRVNKLSVNPDKTEFMVICNPRRTNKFFIIITPLFFLGKNEISRVNKTKYLGMTVNDKLN